MGCCRQFPEPSTDWSVEPAQHPEATANNHISDTSICSNGVGRDGCPYQVTRCGQMIIASTPSVAAWSSHETGTFHARNNAIQLHAFQRKNLASPGDDPQVSPELQSLWNENPRTIARYSFDATRIQRESFAQGDRATGRTLSAAPRAHMLAQSVCEGACR
jgi:hypothetical protein